MNDHNKYVTLTITIAFTILLAASGWAFGIVKNQSQRELIRIETKVDSISDLLQNILITQNLNSNEIGHLKNDIAQYQTEIAQLHRKLNLFMSRGGVYDVTTD